MGREGLYALCPQCPCAGVLYSIVKKGIDYTLRILDRGRTRLPGCRVGPHVSQWQPGPFLVPAMGAQQPASSQQIQLSLQLE